MTFSLSRDLALRHQKTIHALQRRSTGIRIRHGGHDPAEPAFDICLVDLEFCRALAFTEIVAGLEGAELAVAGVEEAEEGERYADGVVLGC